MKHLLKAVVVMIASVIINMVINIVCNMKGIELNTVTMTTASTFLTVAVYYMWIRNEIK